MSEDGKRDGIRRGFVKTLEEELFSCSEWGVGRRIRANTGMKECVWGAGGKECQTDED